MRSAKRGSSSPMSMMTTWARQQLEKEHPDIVIKNLTRSWQSGEAFCALVHHFKPEALPEFDSLEFTPENAEANLELAFTRAEKELGIHKLIDGEDVAVFQDQKSIYTYLSQFYKKFDPKAKEGRVVTGGLLNGTRTQTFGGLGKGGTEAPANPRVVNLGDDVPAWKKKLMARKSASQAKEPKKTPASGVRLGGSDVEENPSLAVTASAPAHGSREHSKEKDLATESDGVDTEVPATSTAVSASTPAPSERLLALQAKQKALAEKRARLAELKRTTTAPAVVQESAPAPASVALSSAERRAGMREQREKQKLEHARKHEGHALVEESRVAAQKAPEVVVVVEEKEDVDFAERERVRELKRAEREKRRAEEAAEDAKREEAREKRRKDRELQKKGDLSSELDEQKAQADAAQKKQDDEKALQKKLAKETEQRENELKARAAAKDKERVPDQEQEPLLVSRKPAATTARKTSLEREPLLPRDGDIKDEVGNCCTRMCVII